MGPTMTPNMRNIRKPTTANYGGEMRHITSDMVLTALRRCPQPSSAVEVCNQMDGGYTPALWFRVSVHLDHLARRGLATYTHDGRERIYTATVDTGRKRP